MKNLLEIDSAFCDHYSSLLEIQRAISKELEVYAFDLNKMILHKPYKTVCFLFGHLMPITVKI